MDIYFVSIPDAFGRLTKKPQNALAVGSQRPQLNCSTDGDNGNNLIEWTYDHVHIVWPPCVSQDPHSFVVSSPDPATDCNVQAASPTAGDISGAYVCSDRTEKAVAMIIQLGSFPLRLITSCIYYDYYCGLLSQLIVEYDRHCLTLSLPTGGHPAISRNGNLQCRVKSDSFFWGGDESIQYFHISVAFDVLLIASKDLCEKKLCWRSYFSQIFQMAAVKSELVTLRVM